LNKRKEHTSFGIASNFTHMFVIKSHSIQNFEFELTKHFVLKKLPKLLKSTEVAGETNETLGVSLDNPEVLFLVTLISTGLFQSLANEHRIIL
jgi:hypothetical protein